MRTYTFKVVVEPDDGRWHAHCPALDRYGAATWGDTEEEAFRNIREVVQMVVEELREDGIAIPEGPHGDVDVYQDTRVAVTV
jgi:predicted RNase H-like HicB family nuclease